MRSSLTRAILGCCALTGVALSSSAAMADWHSPHIYRETNGDWTNVEYDDGVCHYKYSHNSWDNQTNVNRWGDCSRIAIGPGGEVMPVVPAPLVVPVPNADD
jgi:opacity protein-like surface antigen